MCGAVNCWKSDTCIHEDIEGHELIPHTWEGNWLVAPKS